MYLIVIQNKWENSELQFERSHLRQFAFLYELYSSLNLFVRIYLIGLWGEFESSWLKQLGVYGELYSSAESLCANASIYFTEKLLLLQARLFKEGITLSSG